MNCMAEYIDHNGNKQNFYWLSANYGKDCKEQMQKQGIKYQQITGVYTSD